MAASSTLRSSLPWCCSFLLLIAHHLPSRPLLRLQLSRPCPRSSLSSVLCSANLSSSSFAPSVDLWLWMGVKKRRKMRARLHCFNSLDEYWESGRGEAESFIYYYYIYILLNSSNLILDSWNYEFLLGSVLIPFWS